MVKRISGILVLGLILIGSAGALASDLFGVHFPDPTPLYSMDQSTGAATPIGPVSFEYGFASNGRRAAFVRVGRWF